METFRSMSILPEPPALSWKDINCCTLKKVMPIVFSSQGRETGVSAAILVEFREVFNMAEAVSAAVSSVIAALDIGSSAIRMVIAEVDSQGNVRDLENVSKGVSLGKDVFTDGHIGEQTIQAACETLRSFKQTMDMYGVKRYRAVATSAVREAVNTDTFLDRVFLRTGLDVEVIDGPEENRLTLLAVNNILGDELKAGNKEALLIEVGGGSADISVIHNGGPVYAGTYPLGALRLRQSLAGVDGGHQHHLAVLDRHIFNVLETMRRSVPFGKISHVVAAGGDVRFAARQLQGNVQPLHIVPREEFLRCCQEISRYEEDELVKRYHVSYVEAETLGPALRVYKQIVERTSAQTVIIPSANIRQGLLLDMVRTDRRRGLEELSQQVLSSARELARKFQTDEAHANHVAMLAVRMFDQLRPVHGLDDSSRMLLEAAAVLHDIGLFVNSREHHKHSQYLIVSSEIFGLSAHEADLVGNIARYHRRAMPQRSHPSYRGLDAEERMKVCKLAAMLRLANALDKDHAQKVEKVDLEIKDDEVLLRVFTQKDVDLSIERLTLQAKTDLFEEIYGKRVAFQQISRSQG
ncbi:MAG TPA: Ppx/GppA phosphatase family protein [Acidobacteriota bacterium]|jgi:exopolyphosphatase/guanosine-5'-triphosphate,3'-diphosphate pyrophosphatase